MNNGIIFSLKAAIAASAIMLLAACTTNKYSKPSDLERFGLDGQSVSKVAVVCDTAYNKIPEDNYEASFEPSGNLSELRSFFKDGSTMNYEIYSYDDEGRLEEILLLDKDSSLTGRFHYEYDGDFISKCTLYGMNNQDIQTWIHTNDGKQIVQTEFYQEGELQTVSNNKWTHKGEVRKESVTDEEGELVGESTYVYLSPDKPISITSDLLTIVITYDENGLPQHSADVFISSKGDLIPAGNDTQDGAPSIFTYDYTYDSLGRWITRKATLQDGSIYQLLTRTIE